MATVAVTLLRLRPNSRKSIECRKIDPVIKLRSVKGENEISCRYYGEKNAKFNRTRGIGVFTPPSNTYAGVLFPRGRLLTVDSCYII